ncbi:hypothetical protein MesoLj113c_40600 [Mesorhizobium sp. 113-3-9]|nr:hypothetical protein MesoLj113c_40600 [Mesorhizobium sp. 113-3-9]
MTISGNFADSGLVEQLVALFMSLMPGRLARRDFVGVSRRAYPRTGDKMAGARRLGTVGWGVDAGQADNQVRRMNGMTDSRSLRYGAITDCWAHGLADLRA